MQTSPPAARPSLFGRQQDIAAICKIVIGDDVRLMTLAGPPGTGKTALALQLVQKIAFLFKHGAVWVPLASIADPSLLAPTIAHALGIKENPERTLVDDLRAALQERELLLVLDNFEHMIGAAPLLSELLEATSHIKFLVTSRELLHLYGEVHYPVHPLPLPALRPLPPFETLVANPAVALFVERARAVRPDFACTRENVATIAEICARLDGLPLALELAAALSSHLEPAIMLAQLNNRLAFLSESAGQGGPRRQTLRATLDWSYSLLSPGEQRLLAWLGVFVGGWELSALEAVCGSLPELEVDLFDGLAALVDKNLVRADQEAREMRYSVLETIREYALEHLRASGELELLRREHAHYYRTLAEELEPLSSGASQERWLQQLKAEHANLRAALSWALEQQEYELALQIAGACWKFWQIHGHVQEGWGWMETLLGKSEQVQRPARAKALWGAGWLAWVRGDTEAARGRFDEGVRLSRTLGEPRVMGLSLHGLGAIARAREAYEQASQAFEESLPLFQQAGDAEHVAWTLYHLGVIALQQGSYPRAVELLGRSLAQFKQLGQEYAIAEILLMLGSALRKQGAYPAAATMYEESERRFQHLGDQRGVGLARARLAYAAFAEGQLEDALRHVRQALAQLREAGDKLGVVECLQLLARLGRAQADPGRAWQLYSAAAELQQRHKLPGRPDMRGEHEQAHAALQGLQQDLAAAASRQPPTLDEAVAAALEL